MNYISRGLITEGIPGTGKSTLLEKLRQDNIGEKLGCASGFVYSEEITQRVLEKQYNEENIEKEHNIRLLQDIISPLENYGQRLEDRGWDNLQFYYILERFHLTHASYYSYMDWEDVKNMDRRLKLLGAKLCLLTMDEKVFIERIIERRGETWRKYISRYGKTPEEIREHYKRQQQLMRKLASRSNLPVIEIDTTNMKWEQVYNQLISFWIEKDEIT